jgi:hypothetical protein
MSRLVFDLTNENPSEKELNRFANPSTGRRRARTITAIPHALSGRQLIAASLCDLAQRLMGFLLLLFGIGLTLTLWLLPVGLPLALLGCALIATPRDKIVSR